MQKQSKHNIKKTAQTETIKTCRHINNNKKTNESKETTEETYKKVMRPDESE